MRLVPPIARLAFVINAAFLLFASLLFASSAAHAAGGTLVGKTLTRVPGGNNFANRALVQPDGKVLIAGGARFGTLQYQITRYNTDGTLDAAFANGGTILEPLGPGNGQAFAIALQPDGKIVVAGDVTSDRDKFGIARFNADGTLDLLFGGGGSAVSVGPGDAGAFAMAIQADGKIVLGGFSLGPTGKRVFTLVRYTSVDTIDTTFGVNGFVIGAEGTGDEQVNSLGIQADGRIVAAGSSPGGLRMQRYNSDGSIDGTWATTTLAYINSGSDMVVQANDQVAILGSVNGGAVSEVGVLRLNADGNVDTTFGNGACALGACPGVAHASISDSAAGVGLALQGGNYLVSGNTVRPAGQGPAFALTRFTAAGAKDTTFGQNGIAVVQPTGNGDVGRGLAVRADGRIIVAGQANGQFGDTDSVALALTANGALDTTFNGTGFSRLDAGSMSGEWRATALAANGKIVAAGFTTSETGVKAGVIARYNTDGSLDPTFGTAGLTTFPFPANAIAVQVDGMLVVGGTALTGGPARPSMAFARFTANGAVETTFGTGGTTTIAPATADEEINAIAIQADGKVVGAGFVTGTFLDSVFVRLTSTGQLDTTFNGSGMTIASASTGSDIVNGLAIQADGRIVGAGWAEISGTQDSFTVTRLLANGALDTAFGTGGLATASFGALTSHGFAVVVQPDGKIVEGGNIFNTANSTDDFAIARFTTAGVLDPTFGTNGLTTSDFGNHNRIFALARLPNGKLLGAGETGGFFSLVQYLANGTVDTTFGSNGSSAVQINAGNDFANTLTVANDGTLFVGGNGSGLLALARFTSDIATTTADLAIAQLASPSPAVAGQNVTFTLTVSNAGPAPASAVTVTDTLPAGVTLVSASAGCSNTSGTITCNVGTLASGASAPLTIVVHTTAPTSITNNASVTAAEADPSTANNTSAATVTVNAAPPTNADVSITQVASAGTVTAGGAVTFTLTVANAGPASASGVTVTDTLPAGITVTAMSPACSGSTTLTCNVGTLAAGAGTQLTVTVQTSAAGTISNTATVSATQPDPSGANNTSSASVTVNAAPPTNADVSISQAASAGAVTVGDAVTFTLTVANAGPASASGITVTDTLPAGLTVTAMSPACTNGSGTLTCNVGTLAAGASAQLTVSAQTTATGTISNVATVSAAQADPSSANNTSSASVTVTAVPAGTVVNLSTRGEAGNGNNVLIAGFIIGGSAPKTVVVVAQGPSLRAGGITNPLPNPALTLVRSSDGAIIAGNDDWGTAANAAQVQAAGFAPPDPSEAAIMMTLDPGAYTAIVSDPSGATGVGIVAVFEVDHPEVPLINISTRGQVFTGNDVMIAGFIIQGNAPRTVVIQGIGPSLTAAGVPDALANPTLTLVRSSDGVIIASNDDWQTASNAADIQAAGFAPGSPVESAIMVTLPPGAYTAILAGAGGGTGNGIIGVFSK